MQLEQELGALALELTRLPDRAELLGAIFGDGYVQQRGRRSQKVAVTVSDQYPAWRARVRELFMLTFGHCHETKRGKGRRGFYEYYVTTHDLSGMLFVAGKYTDDQLAPPRWIERHPELCRRFMRGLVATDGAFVVRRENRCAHESSRERNVAFIFAQKDETLAEWFWARLCEDGFPASKQTRADGMSYIRVFRFEEVRRLGEWLESYKWQALLDDGFDPDRPRVDRKTGQPVAAREPVFCKTIPMEEQQRWRELRRAGASLPAIGRHFGRSNSVVGNVVADIVPTRVATAEELGLKPRPRIPRKVPPEEVERWREEVAAGASAASVARKYNRRSAQVNEATCDVAWDRRLSDKSH